MNKIYKPPYRGDDLFISRLQLWHNHQAAERLKTIKVGIDYDQNLNGVWVKRGSTAHNLAVILGFAPWDPKQVDMTAPRKERTL
jgi:hypothetical protein